MLVARAAGERDALGLTLVVVASAGGAAAISVVVGSRILGCPKRTPSTPRARCPGGLGL